MTRRATDGQQRAFFLWAIAGTSLIVAAAAGAAVVEVLRGTADAGTFVWGMIGIAALLESLVLFAVGLRLRHQYLNQVQSYGSRGDCLPDDGSRRPGMPLLGDGQATQNITNQSLGGNQS
jgi:heme exporter protein D